MHDDEVGTGRELERVQRWLQAVVTEAGDVCSGIAPAQAAWPDARHAAGIVLPSATLTADERVAIYRRSYHARLMGCFDAVFPCLRDALGVELFGAFAADYLHAFPPTSYTLDRLADRFGDHLVSTRPDASNVGDDHDGAERETWIEFIVGLATLEHALLRTFDGPGPERSAPRTAHADVVRADAAHGNVAHGDVAPEDIGGLRPALAPGARLMRFGVPVHEYYRAWRRAGRPEFPSRRPCCVLLSRREYRVRIDELPAFHCAVLERLDGRTTIADVLAALHRDGVVPDIAPRMLAAVVGMWLDNGWVEEKHDVRMSNVE